MLFNSTRVLAYNLIVKPTVFLSHSSHDSPSLNAFRDLLVARTGSAIDFFLSSDGQSIPLGRNWIHRIERALDDARVMLVFLTPESLKSQWIYFEAGYAYSKGVRVVPIGALGTDLSQLRPPLSLLQGFNLRGADSMSNVIAVLNQEFNLTFTEGFSSAEYTTVFGNTPRTETPVRLVDNLALTVPGEAASMIAAARRQLAVAGLEFEDREKYLMSFGISIASFDHGRDNVGVRIELDAQALDGMLAVVDALLASREGASRPAIVDIEFLPEVQYLEPYEKLTSRLVGCEIKFVQRGSFELNGVVVEVRGTRSRVEAGPYLTTLLKAHFQGTLSESPVFAIVELLFERGALFVT